MTEREKQLCEAYIPSPRDPELDPMDYYVIDLYGKCRRGHIRDIIPYEDGTAYLLYTDAGKRITGCRGEYGAFTMGDLYDNKQDCKDMTHLWIDFWEELRRLT